MAGLNAKSLFNVTTAIAMQAGRFALAGVARFNFIVS